MAREADPLDGFGKIVDDFASIMTVADRAVRGQLAYRHELLWVHAVAAILLAPTFSLTNVRTPAFAFLRMLPGAPGSLGALVGFGGLLLVIGLLLQAIPVKMVGLTVLATFYSLLGFSFTVPVWLYATGHLGGMRPALYAPIVYFHLTVVMLIHVHGRAKALRL